MVDSRLLDSTAEEKSLSSDRGIVQALLRSGLALSVLLMLAGAIADFGAHHLLVTSVRFDDLLGIGRAQPLVFGDKLMGWGILVLAATPAFRVIALFFLWMRERDWKFVVVAAVVMVTLALSIILGRG